MGTLNTLVSLNPGGTVDSPDGEDEDDDMGLLSGAVATVAVECVGAGAAAGCLERCTPAHTTS